MLFFKLFLVKYENFFSEIQTKSKSHQIYTTYVLPHHERVNIILILFFDLLSGLVTVDIYLTSPHKSKCTAL